MIDWDLYAIFWHSLVFKSVLLLFFLSMQSYRFPIDASLRFLNTSYGAHTDFYGCLQSHQHTKHGRSHANDSFICCNFILDSILFDATMSRLQHTPLHSSFFLYLRMLLFICHLIQFVRLRLPLQPIHVQNIRMANETEREKNNDTQNQTSSNV